MMPLPPEELQRIATWWFCCTAQRKRRAMWAASEVGGQVADVVQEVLLALEKHSPPPTVSWSTAVCKQCKWTSAKLIDKAVKRREGLAAWLPPDEVCDGGQEDVVWLQEVRKAVAAMMNTLTYREREIIKLRYGIGDGYSYTLKETARILKVTRERIRQIEMKAIHRIRQNRGARLRALYEDKYHVSSNA